MKLVHRSFASPGATTKHLASRIIVAIVVAVTVDILDIGIDEERSRIRVSRSSGAGGRCDRMRSCGQHYRLPVAFASTFVLRKSLARQGRYSISNRNKLNHLPTPIDFVFL